MNWHPTPLGGVLRPSQTPITLLAHEVYKQAAVQPYPRGVVLKAVKQGFDFPRKRQKLLRAGQLVISQSRVHRRLWGMVPPELDGAVAAQEYLTFDLRPNLHPDFLSAYLATAAFRQAALAACGSRLNLRLFLEIPLPLPPLEEQRRAAELWQSAGAALAHTAEMLDSLVALKSGVAGSLFQNTNASWEHTTLGECAVIGADTPAGCRLWVIPPDQIVFGAAPAEDGAIGIRPGVALDSLFLYYYLESYKPALPSGAKPGPDAILRAIPLPLPTLYEQRKIAAALQQHDEALAWLRAEQAALRRLVQGIMHYMFGLDEPALRNVVGK